MAASLRWWSKLGNTHFFFLFPLKDFDVCLKLVVHPQFIHSFRCLFCGFYMSVTAATIVLDVPPLSTETT